MADAAAPLKILSIVGAGRSGTTVLASILGEVEGFASAGELRWFWERGIVDQRPCGCGLATSDCEVWSPVAASALGTSDLAEQQRLAHQVIGSQLKLTGRRSLLRVLRSADGGDGDWAPLREVRMATGAAVRAFAAQTSAHVVVDTSKRPQDAAVFAALEGVEVYVLHLVRDPRAVVHSWRRAKTFSVGGQTRAIGTRRLPSTVRRWLANCLSAETLRRKLPASRWLHMRYEDFARQPRAAVAQILSLLDETGEAPFEADDTVLLHPNHIIAGNPSRFTVGSVKIRADEEWRDQMPRREQRLVELATFPLMVRYGYALSRLSR